jgi:hypothetical protein
MGVSGQRHAPAALYPRGNDLGTYWIGGWVSPRAGLDAGARRKILCPCRGSNPGRSVRSQTLYCLSYLLISNAYQEAVIWDFSRFFSVHSPKCWDHHYHHHHHHQLLRIRLYGLFQFRITSEITSQFRHLVGLLGRVISPSQGLYLHRTTQHRKTKTKHTCFERYSNLRSQYSSGQNPRPRPRATETSQEMG